MNDSVPDKIDSNDPAFLYLNLHPEEEIKMIVRHHWAGFLGNLMMIIGMVFAPLLILIVIKIALKSQADPYIPAVILFFSGFILFLLTFLLGSWANFYFDIIIVTNRRIINVDQIGLLARQTSELSLRQIQDVTAEVNGFLRSILNYGLLVIETAGEGTGEDHVHTGVEGYFTIHDLPDPNKIARVIIELHREAIHEEEEPAN